MDDQNQLPQEQMQEQVPALPSYTVDGLLEKLGVTANVQVWKSIDAIVHVQGVVTGKVKTYGNVVYFELKGGANKITVKCPYDLRPEEGDNIIVEGLPVLKPSRFNTGLDVIIEGKPVRSAELPDFDKDRPEINLQKDSFTRLHDYFAQHWVTGFCITGTETALRDVISQIQPDIREHIQTKIIRVSKKEDMLSDLSDAFEEDYNAFSIVRGGDDASLALWNDPDVIRKLLEYECPFYVALGHTHFISLTTQYADESFHTPTDFGLAINTVTKRLLNEHNLMTEVEALKKHKVEVDKDSAVLKEKEKNFDEKLQTLNNSVSFLHQKNNKYKIIILLLGIAVAGLGYFLMK